MRSTTCDQCGQGKVYNRLSKATGKRYLFDIGTQRAHYLSCPSATDGQRKEAEKIQAAEDQRIALESAKPTVEQMIAAAVEPLRKEIADLRALIDSLTRTQ